MIQSSPFSLVRFEHPAPNDYSLDIPYSLPAFGKHDVLFHFIVANDRPLDQYIKLGLADTDGNLIRPFDPAAGAIPLSYRYRIAGLLNYDHFDLHYITIGMKQVDYGGLFVTRAKLAQLLMDDFGVELTGDYLVFPAVLDVRVDGSYAGQPIWPESGFISPVWHEGYTGISNTDIMEGECFTYALLDWESNTVLGWSNVFKVVDEEPFTSLLTYGCRSNAYDFTYAWDESNNWFGQRMNRVRVPLYLKLPDWPTKRVVNKQSGGRTQLLSATVEKQYAIETEHMPEVFHECLRIALVHDFLLVQNNNIREGVVEVIEADNYSAQWNDEQKLTYAQGKGTVKVATFGFANSNC